MMRGAVLLLALLALGCNGRNVADKLPEFTIQQPLIALLQGGGLRIGYPAEEGTTLFAVHYSINKPVPGVSPGDYNYDVTSPTGNFFVHENNDLNLVIGDIVYYWIYVVNSGLGYQLLEQQWTAAESTIAPTEALQTTITDYFSTISTARGFFDSVYSFMSLLLQWCKSPFASESTTVQPVPTTTVTTVTTVYTTTTAAPSSTNSGTASTQPSVSTTKESVTDPDCTEYPCLIFEDNFNTLNFKTWEHEISMSGGGNWEFQYYTNNRTNSYTKEGLLYIKPTLTSDTFGEAFLSSGTLDLWGMSPASYCTANSFYGCMRVGTPTNYINPIQSARIRSVKSFNVRYGKIEVEAQLPKGDWLWPAIWMLPESEVYAGWPASGEIDLMESRGNFDLTSGGESKGHDNIGATLHWGPSFYYNAYAKTSEEASGDFGDSMHRYGAEWDENSLKLLLDDEVILNVEPTDGGFWELGDFGLPDASNPWKYGSKMAPFDQSFYFVLNVAVGGTNGFFPDEWTANPPKPWSNQSPTAMRDFWQAKNDWYPTWNPDEREGEDAALKINYVRVWKTKPDPE